MYRCHQCESVTEGLKAIALQMAGEAGPLTMPARHVGALLATMLLGSVPQLTVEGDEGDGELPGARDCRELLVRCFNSPRYTA